MRVLKRCFNRYFGGSFNFFVWMIGIIVMIYILDTFFLTKSSIPKVENYEVKTLSESHHNLNDKNIVKKSVVNNSVVVSSVKSKASVLPDKSPKVRKLNCGLVKSCGAGEMAISVKSGEGSSGDGKFPSVCFNDISPFTKSNTERGVNIAVFDDTNNKLVEVRNFDTYVSDIELINFLKTGIKDGHIVILASFDEMSNGITDNSKKLLEFYGSRDIGKVKFRDTYIFIGQRGLQSKAPIEKMSQRGTNKFAPQVSESGCLALPMGIIKPIDAKKLGDGKNDVKKGEEHPNCGVKDSCGVDSFPVHIYTGESNTKGPKICVSGKYVLAKGLNGGGRGFNIAVVDPLTKDVKRVGHFDTYSEDSSNMEIFLEMLDNDDIILAVVHDDASKKLSDTAKKLFNELGSSMIQNVKFRDVWNFIGQKNIIGFSPIEQLETKREGSSFPIPLEKRLCVKTKIKGSLIKPDPMANKNEKKRAFCSKYDGYGDFCSVENIDDMLTPAPLADKSIENHPIFDVPIVVIPGLSHNAIRMQLETLLMQPGLNPNMVTIMYDEKFDESAHLANLFNFKTAKLSSSTKYIWQMHKAMEEIWKMYPIAKYTIILEEEVILAQDFLYFLSQCLDIIEKDASISGISAWNENGYEPSSFNNSLVYRVETFPGLGFLLKKSFYESMMKNDMNKCCQNRSWDGWFGGKPSGFEMLVPDMSRVYRRPYEGLSERAAFITELFNRPRNTNMNPDAKIINPGELTEAAYEIHMINLIKGAVALDTSNAEDCLKSKGLGFYIPKSNHKTYSIYFFQKNMNDYSILQRLCKCFKLFSVSGYKPRGLHKNALRFTIKNNTIIMIGSFSPYFKFKPSNMLEVKD